MIAADGKLNFTFSAVLLTALLAGSLDIAAAFLNSYIISRTSPVIILQFIGSGVLGSQSFEGGYLSAFTGLVFHYFIAFSWTTIFFFFYPVLKIAPEYKVLSGLVYGIVIWLIMNLIVIPLSNTPPYMPGVVQVVLGFSFIMFLVGLPISLMFHRYSRKNFGKAGHT